MMVFGRCLVTALAASVLWADMTCASPLETIEPGSNPFQHRNSTLDVGGYTVELISLLFFVLVAIIAVGATHMLDETRRKFHYTIVVLALVTLMTYLAIFTKYPLYAESQEKTDRISYVPRFMSWMVVFPLQGALLCGLAKPDSTTSALVPASLFLFGLCAYRGSLQTKETVKGLWLLFGVVFTVPVIAALKGRLVESVRSVGPKASVAYGQVSYFTWKPWVAYIVVYLLCTVAGWIPEYIEVVLYGILDIYCIGGTAFFLLLSKAAIVEATGH